MDKIKIIFLAAICSLAAAWNLSAQNTNMSTTNVLAWNSQPLSLVNALNLALQQNATILEARNDLEASHGIVIQTRAVALPQLTAGGQYKDTDPSAVESIYGF